MLYMLLIDDACYMLSILDDACYMLSILDDACLCYRSTMHTTCYRSMMQVVMLYMMQANVYTRATIDDA